MPLPFLPQVLGRAGAELSGRADSPSPVPRDESRRGRHPDRPVLPSTPSWRAALPILEAEIAEDLKAFRKSMKAARILPDFTNRDIFPASRSGAWEIFHEARTLESGERLGYTIYVRRSSDQLAVNENGGHPYILTSNFTGDFPWTPPTAEDLRRGMKSRMRSFGVRPQ